MRYSKLFGKTTKTVSNDIKLSSHKLLVQGGFIRESTAGRYFMLPLGIRVQQKIVSIIKEEMDKAGAQEMITPVLHPIELWEETNRNNAAGFELMQVKDRRGAKFALGGTAEEMFVDVVRKFPLSYKDLPFNIYQFSTKFRDELRARGGLLRVREFVMKDAYSFDIDEEAFKVEYKKMWDTYTRIFKRLGYDTKVVESDNGYIGGEYCHEFVVEHPEGETKFLEAEDGSYAAHEDVALFQRHVGEGNEALLPRQDIEGKGIIGVAELAKFLHIPETKTTKTMLYETETGEIIAAAVNGIYDINETKLKHVAGCLEVKLATSETVKKVTGAEVGYAGILNLPSHVRVIMDISLQNRINFECGANRTNYHSININFGRDLPLPERFYEIALAKDGYSAQNGQKLIAKRGIEVGNIFQLGYHYSHLMEGATFTDKDGTQKPYYMGCYGIGIGRNLQTIVEMHRDARGIIWPKAVAPYQVHLINLSPPLSKGVGAEQPGGFYDNHGEEVYQKLLDAGIEVLFDDRTDVSAGQKFADADLIGCPFRLVVSPRTGEKVEWKRRDKKETEMLSLDEALKRLKE